MKEQLIEFETAKLAKEKGFDIPCTKIYNTLGDLWDSHYSDMSNDDVDPGACCTSPTQSLLQKWLREKHNIQIDSASELVGDNIEYCVDVWFNDRRNFNCQYSGSSYAYEQALEKGLFEALKLIKNKNS